MKRGHYVIKKLTKEEIKDAKETGLQFFESIVFDPFLCSEELANDIRNKFCKMTGIRRGAVKSFIEEDLDKKIRKIGIEYWNHNFKPVIMELSWTY